MPLDRVEFARRVKDKYPQYQDVDDLELADAVLKKYPQYRSVVSVASHGETPVGLSGCSWQALLP